MRAAVRFPPFSTIPDRSHDMPKLPILALALAQLLAPDLRAAAQIAVDPAPVPGFAALAAQADYTLEPFESVPEIAVEPQLINGTPVNPALFPGVVRMTTGGTCTAAVVGPATILLAAHCMPDRARINFKLGAASVQGICLHSPGYSVGIAFSNDLALCLLSNRITGMVYESVDIARPTASGEIVALTGYGCTFEDGPLDGRLRIGVSKIVAKPSANWPNDPSTIYSRSDVEAGGAVVCPGDSGGPLFRTGEDLAGPRKIVGVNSRTTYSAGVSLFAAVASAAGAAFLKDWTTANGTEICGVNRQTGCK
jgi:hypothetical protein